MPVVAVSVKRLNELLGKQFEMGILVNALEGLGCDVEDTAELSLYLCPACSTPNDKLSQEDPPKKCEYCGHESDEAFKLFASDLVIRIDLLADRPDLFDAGGLSRALRGYMGIEKGLPLFDIAAGSISVEIDPALSARDSYRPFIACAVVNVPPLDHNSLREIMRLQENLHWGIGRDRKLSSIGVYDLEVIKHPIRYTIVDPISFKFRPLGMREIMTPRNILDKHPKGMAYAHLMENYKKYPILIDSKDLVLSMPPIINSDETKCKIGTSKLFIDVTGLNQTAVDNSLNTLISSLTQLGGKTETVEMRFPDRTIKTPDLSTKRIEIKFNDAKKWLGLDFTEDDFINYLQKMRLDIVKKDIGECYEVSYPAFRTDIRHPVDIFEDLAIGYGFENIDFKLVPTLTVGNEREEEKISQLVRESLIGMGFTEIMSLNLQSIERHFNKFQIEPDGNHVEVENPKTIEQKVIRNHLMTGIMETFYKNRRRAVPQQIFEIGNVIFINPEMETGVNEYRHIAFGIIGPNTGYAEARMFLDSILRELGQYVEYKTSTHPSFIDGRFAEVNNSNGIWARVGEIHPQVLNNFGLAYPVSMCELRLLKII